MTSGAEEPTAARRASGSSFYAAMRILPRARREAIYEVYGFCRAVDDVADDGGPRAERQAGLAQWRADVDALYAGAAPPHLSGLVEPVNAFALRREDFLAVIDGMEMDVVDDIRAPDFATLDLYCDRVASAVGRLCVRIFGIAGEDGIALAHHLGRALQLTNILRDVDEDAAMGRLYLPREALVEAGITTAEPQAALASPNLAVACGEVMDRVREHFRAADDIMARQPRAAVRAPAIMGAAYKLIFARLAARGWSPPRAPIRLSKLQLAWVILRHIVL